MTFMVKWAERLRGRASEAGDGPSGFVRLCPAFHFKKIAKARMCMAWENPPGAGFKIRESGRDIENENSQNEAISKSRLSVWFQAGKVIKNEADQAV